jgi:flagellar hook-length control protein FliK
MNTPVIMNPIAATPGRQQNAPADGVSSDVSFNKVLSREVANRNDSAAAPVTPAGTASQTTAKSTSKSTDKDKTKEHDDKSSTDAAAADASAQNAPANLLALVANIGQVTGTDKAAAAPAADVKASADVKLGVDAVKADPAAQIDTKSAVADQLTAAKDAKGADDTAAPDFAAEMKRGAELQQPATAVATKALPAQLAPEASAGDLTAKVAADTISTQAAASAQAVATMTAVQQAMQTGIQAVPVHVADRLAPQVGTPGWDNALAQRVVWMVAGSEQSASLTLNPPDLGPLQVVLNVSNSTANATFVAAQPEVRQALEAAMPKLRDMLGEAGIQLGQTTVSSGGTQQNQNGAQPEPARHAGSAADTRIDGVDTQIRMPRGRTVSSGNGLVDTFV